MVVFLLIGSGEVQPWALKRPAGPTAPEETSLTGIVSSSKLLIFNKCFLLAPAGVAASKELNEQ
jgi:hypothetical protein